VFEIIEIFFNKKIRLNGHEVKRIIIEENLYSSMASNDLTANIVVLLEILKSIIAFIPFGSDV